VPVLRVYLKDVLDLVSNNDCIVDDYFGIVAFLNVLPLLFHLGSWKEAHGIPLFKECAVLINCIFCNIIHRITPPTGDVRRDSVPSLVELPETESANILIERLITDEDDRNSTQGLWRKEILSSHPKSFACIAAIEVLGWWSFNGVDLKVPSPTAYGPPLDLPGAIKEYEDNIRHLIRRTPEFDYIEPIITAIIDSRKPPKPHQTRSLLYGPLCNFHRRCGVSSCRKTEVVARCTGGCGGLEYYCSKEHQKEHWKIHKHFCRKQSLARNG